MRNKVDKCLFSKTKLDGIFPNQQHKIHGFKLHQRDRNKHGGRVIFYINEIIPCKAMNLEEVPNDCEIIFIEFSIKIRKWLRIDHYKLPSQNAKHFLDNLLLILNKQKYDNIKFIGENKTLKTVMSTFHL